jgi:hypothetical protein
MTILHQAAADIGAHPAKADYPDLHENSLSPPSGADLKISSQYCSIMHGHAFKRTPRQAPAFPAKSRISA